MSVEANTSGGVRHIWLCLGNTPGIRLVLGIEPSSVTRKVTLRTIFAAKETF